MEPDAGPRIVSSQLSINAYVPAAANEGNWATRWEAAMRYFIQAFIVIVGFGVAMTSFAAEHMSAGVASCFAEATICK